MRKRKVAVHMMGSEPTIEGLLKSYNTSAYGGHYVVELADVVVAPGNTLELEGRRVVRIPRERVSWVQEL